MDNHVCTPVIQVHLQACRLWITAISRADLTEKALENDRVCGGVAAKQCDRYNRDWVPSLKIGTRVYFISSNVVVYLEISSS